MFKRISARLTGFANSFYPLVFKSTNAGVEYVLESFPYLFTRTNDELSSIFDLEERRLIIMALRDIQFVPQLAGQHILTSVQDAIVFFNIEDQFKGEKKEIIKKIKNLTNFQAYCMEIWARNYWLRHDSMDDLDQYTLNFNAIFKKT